MPQEASILVTLRDQYSPGVRTMREANSGFGRSLDETRQRAQAYQTRLSSLVEQQGKLQVELVDAKRALKEAESAYKATGGGSGRRGPGQRQRKYEALNVVMRETVQASKDTQSALRDLEGQQRQTVQSGSGTSVLSALGKAGLLDMAGDVALGLRQPGGGFRLWLRSGRRGVLRDLWRAIGSGHGFPAWGQWALRWARLSAAAWACSRAVPRPHRPGRRVQAILFGPLRYPAGRRGGEPKRRRGNRLPARAGRDCLQPAPGRRDRGPVPGGSAQTGGGHPHGVRGSDQHVPRPGPPGSGTPRSGCWN